MNGKDFGKFRNQCSYVQQLNKTYYARLHTDSVQIEDG